MSVEDVLKNGAGQEFRAGVRVKLLTRLHADADAGDVGTVQRVYTTGTATLYKYAKVQFDERDAPYYAGISIDVLEPVPGQLYNRVDLSRCANSQCARPNEWDAPSNSPRGWVCAECRLVTYMWNGGEDAAAAPAPKAIVTDDTDAVAEKRLHHSKATSYRWLGKIIRSNDDAQLLGATLVQCANRSTAARPALHAYLNNESTRNGEAVYSIGNLQGYPRVHPARPSGAHLLRHAWAVQWPGRSEVVVVDEVDTP